MKQTIYFFRPNEKNFNSIFTYTFKFQDFFFVENNRERIFENIQSITSQNLIFKYMVTSALFSIFKMATGDTFKVYYKYDLYR